MQTIQEVLDQYFAAWTSAFRTKNDEEIREWMSPHFRGYWAHAKIEEPEQYDRNYDIEGVLQQYEADTIKSFEALSVSELSDGQETIVVGTENSIIKGKLHKAKCMFIWRKEGQTWKLLREYIELEN